MSLHTHELTLGFSFLLGAIHALEPGHGKTAMLVYLLGEKRSYWHPIVMGLSTAISHSVSLFAIAFVVHLTHHVISGDHHHEQMVSEVLQWISAVLVLLVGAWMLWKSWRGKGQACCHHHHHDGEACSNHTHLVTLDGPACHHTAEEKPRNSARTSYSTTALLGIAVGLLPCPSALAAYFTGLSTGQPWLAYTIIALFAAGIATSLAGVGILLQVFGERFGQFSTKARQLPWGHIRALLILAIGVYYVGRLVLVQDADIHVH
ncbi:sulfite exporter TauE/SafE family protein [Blastopirellula marina]|uniref:Nickel/cobalt efflux system n=1 Tax=Blastopirellula marina TaxID=124 RepID=A0A2S8G195_9BACT|nr:sulfite exporter TauE/SafE family protein [Blastopirellula marina]PQO38031.1 cobalt transporter [Blastopirellula marina]PTL44687.1 cobalt transporter [Blastopirellula marina]